MRKYMKPVLEVSEDMTEGVYLASGNAQDEEKTTCRFGRTEANPGSDKCQTCSVSGGVTNVTPEGQESYRNEAFTTCPDHMPVKES